MAARVPAVLGKDGKKIWSAITAKFDLRPDELVTLEDVCLISDVIALLETAWADEKRPMTTKGSMGQQVIHPLIGEIRTQRMARNSLWRQLKLPDDAVGPAVNQQRDAANVKHAAPWSGRGA
jgi:DNA-binding ferritin-like protein (Dps family)